MTTDWLQNECPINKFGYVHQKLWSNVYLQNIKFCHFLMSPNWHYFWWPKIDLNYWLATYDMLHICIYFIKMTTHTYSNWLWIFMLIYIKKNLKIFWLEWGHFGHKYLKILDKHHMYIILNHSYRHSFVYKYIIIHIYNNIKIKSYLKS